MATLFWWALVCFKFLFAMGLFNSISFAEHVLLGGRVPRKVSVSVGSLEWYYILSLCLAVWGWQGSCGVILRPSRGRCSFLSGWLFLGSLGSPSCINSKSTFIKREYKYHLNRWSLRMRLIYRPSAWFYFSFSLSLVCVGFYNSFSPKEKKLCGTVVLGGTAGFSV